MRRIDPYRLWLGHAGDLRTHETLFANDIRAVVDLSANEPIAELPRDLVYCRIPLTDGGGNDLGKLRLAVATVTALVAAEVPAAVCCSNGLSRSPAIAAAALATIRRIEFDTALIEISAGSKHDVSPGFWNQVKAACQPEP